MKTKVLLLLAVFLTLSAGAFANSCPIAPMTTYLAKGFSCAIDDRTFSNFGYQSKGTLGITAGKVTVTPIAYSPTEAGFQFSGGWTTLNGAYSDSIISYLTTANQGLLNYAGLSIRGGSFTGLANIDVVDRLCLSLSDPACTHPLPTDTNYLRLEAFMGPRLGTRLGDYIDFAGVQQLFTVRAISLTSSGRGGFATLSLVKNAVPEPAGLVLLSSGMLGLAYFARKKFPRKST